VRLTYGVSNLTAEAGPYEAVRKLGCDPERCEETGLSREAAAFLNSREHESEKLEFSTDGMSFITASSSVLGSQRHIESYLINGF